MPLLSWRTDADGFAFENSCTFDANDQPARTAIRNLPWARLLSLGSSVVLKKTVDWSVLLNQVPNWFGRAEGLKNRTMTDWDLIRSHINACRLSLMALIYAGRAIWDQHQVPVYGYENTGSNKGKLFVYDSKSPSQFGSTGHSELTLDFSDPTLTATSPTDSGDMLGGFFAVIIPCNTGRNSGVTYGSD